MRNVFNSGAYQDGLRAGKSDRSLGYRSKYAWNGVEVDPVYSYSWHFSRGYRDAWRR